MFEYILFLSAVPQLRPQNTPKKNRTHFFLP
jgi:hypothetical protein